jgi:hypothetical protein
MRFRTIALLVGLTGCTVGAPPGFSSGESWSFPLVGPLEDGLLIAPVFINDKGPYLMAIDPDARFSAVDQAIVSENQLYSVLGPRILDETDTHRPVSTAEVKAFRLGKLTVRNRTVLVVKVGAFNSGGRQIRGILGRDVIADSLVFGFDRERGIASLATRKGFTAPAGATSFGFRLLTNRLATQIPPVGRKLTKARIGSATLAMHVDLGAMNSQLRQNRWSDAGLSSVPIATATVDEIGTWRKFDSAAVANQVTVGNLTASSVLFGPYDDRRWDEQDIDGTLGLNFFRGFNVWADWDDEVVYVVPRGDAVASIKQRIARWGSATLDACKDPGCVTVELIDGSEGIDAGPAPGADPATDAPQPPPPPEPTGGPPSGGSGAPAIMKPPSEPIVLVQRDAAAEGVSLEVLFQAVDAQGKPLELPRLVANLPPDASRATQKLDSAYAGAKLVVLDVSPYPRACAKGGGCVAALVR